MAGLTTAIDGLYDATMTNAADFLLAYLPFVAVVVGLAIVGIALGFVVRFFRE